MAQLSITNWSPETPTDKQAVLGQLHRLLAHPLFKSSKRCSSLLRYIVESCLSGEASHLKERTIGSQLFNRIADYDTSSDPVVRSAAFELRKRIAQYYHEPSHSHELRIELPVGSYVALFELPTMDRSTESMNSEAASKPPLPRPPSTKRPNHRRFVYAIAACVAAVVIAGALWSSQENHQSSLDQFWRAVASAPGPILLCVGTRNAERVSSGSREDLEHPWSADFRDVLPITDAMAFSGIATFLGETKKAYRVQSAKATTMSDLMQGPTVVVGAFDNPWAIRITDPLRFHFEEKGENFHYIADRKNENAQYIEIESETPGRDFAIVARVFNNATGQITVVAAGLGAQGTTAASEFLTSRNYMDYLLRQTPTKAASKNIEAVISVPVVDNTPGAPHIEAVEVW